MGIKSFFSGLGSRLRNLSLKFKILIPVLILLAIVLFSVISIEVTGQNFFCNTCHEINQAQGFFGSNGLTNFIGAPQDIKIPHLRNMYQKVGMFGMPEIDNITDNSNIHIRQMLGIFCGKNLICF